jgi:general secretion pathway protein K
LVLWLVVVLGAVAAAVVGSTRRGSSVVNNARARTVARYAAESGIVAAAAIMDRHLAAAYTPVQQFSALAEVDREFIDLGEVSLGNARFAVALTNLNARLDLNHADPEALVGLFSQFTSAQHARSVVDAVQDWRDADELVRPQGAEERTYRRAGLRIVPRNAPLSRLDELGRMIGVTDSLMRSVAPYVTVSGDARVDINAAPEPVLAALPGIGPAGARALVSRRSRGAFSSVYQVAAVLGPAAAPTLRRLVVTPSRLLLVGRGWMPGHSMTYEIQAAYAIVGQRLRLQSWRERDL